MTIATSSAQRGSFINFTDAHQSVENAAVSTHHLSEGGVGATSPSLQLIAKNPKDRSKPSRVRQVSSFDPNDIQVRKKFYRKLCGSYEAAELYERILFIWQLDKNGAPKVKNVRHAKSGGRLACYWWGHSREKLAEKMGWSLEQLKYRLKTLKNRGLIDTISAKTPANMMQVRPTVANGAAALSGWPDASNYQGVAESGAEIPAAQDIQAENSSPASEENFLFGLGVKIPHLNTSIKKKEIHVVREKTYKPCDPVGSHEFLEKIEKYFQGEEIKKNHVEDSNEKKGEAAAKVKKAKSLPYPPPTEPQADPFANYRRLEAEHDMERLLEICADAGFAKATWKMMPDPMCALLLEIKQRLACHPSYSLEEILFISGISSKVRSDCFGPWMTFNGWEHYSAMRGVANPKDADRLWKCKPNLKSLLTDFKLILDWLGPDALATDKEGAPTAPDVIGDGVA